jgi:hypothetical protein
LAAAIHGGADVAAVSNSFHASIVDEAPLARPPLTRKTAPLFTIVSRAVPPDWTTQTSPELRTSVLVWPDWIVNVVMALPTLRRVPPMGAARERWCVCEISLQTIDFGSD